MQRLARRIAENTVNIYQKDDLDPDRYADPYPAKANRGEEWFWLLRPGHYTSQRGLDLGGEEGEQESWGAIL